MSFAAFFVHYMNNLRPFPRFDASFESEHSPIISQDIQPSNDVQRSGAQSTIILGGYSYGSLILRHLRPLSYILQSFSESQEGSAAAEIVLRAHKLADQSNLEWIERAQNAERKSRSNKGHEAKHSLTVGGEETSPQQRRSSRETRRSAEGTRNVLRTRLRSISHRGRPTDVNTITPQPQKEELSFSMPNVRYLLISPLTPPISALAATGLGPKLWSKQREEHGEVVGKHATLAIYGDQDMFSSAKRIRDWSEQLAAAPDSQFRSVEVAGAGHFWFEDGVEEKLRTTLKEWARDCSPK